MEQRQKRPPEQVQQTFEHTGAACWFCLVTIKGDRTCASSGWKSQTEVKTKRQNHLRHANKPKKRRNKNRFPKMTSWGNLKFRSCSHPSWIVQYRRNILRASGNKNYYSLTLTWVAEDDCKELPSSCSCSWRDDRKELSSSTSCRWLVAVAFRSPSDHDRFFGKKPNPLNV